MTTSTDTHRRTAPVAGEVHRQLSRIGLRETAEDIDRTIDWAGPVDKNLDDEFTVQAACGIMHVHGRSSGRPEPLALNYARTAASILGVQGVIAALIARGRGLSISAVRTSVSQAALLSVSQYLATATSEKNHHPTVGGTAPPFVSADGVPFELEALGAETWQRFWRHLDAPDDAIRVGWEPFRKRFATAVCPLPPGLHETVSRYRFGEISATSARVGSAVVRVRDRPGGDDSGLPWRGTPLPGTVLRRTNRPSEQPLDGLVVVESTNRVQGPLAGHILRMLGAEVIRLEPPGGDPQRGEPPEVGGCSARFLALNAGKRPHEIDLKARAGTAELAELVSGADVFLHNWAPSTADRLGIDCRSLHRLRSDLVYAAASGWGDGLGLHPPVATDFLVQAHSGVAAALRPRGTAPAPSLMTLTDVLGGLVCAQGVLAALLQRLRTGRGARIDSSLLSAACALPRSDIRPVWTALDRPLPTSDGHLMLSEQARSEQARTYRVLGSPDDASALPARCRRLSTSAWLEKLEAAGLHAIPVCDDLRKLAGNPAFSRVLADEGYPAVLPPWEFR